MKLGAKQALADLKGYASAEKKQVLQRFFKTGAGEYGEGDVFLGVVVPQTRKLARTYREMGWVEVRKLLRSPYHEARLLGLFIMVEQYKKADPAGREKIFHRYMENRKAVNNWDLVDTTAPYIVGEWLIDKGDRKRGELFRLARSESLWDRRIAMISTFAWIRKGDFEDTIRLAELLLNDSHDLMHKAVGWMLREVGKRDEPVLETFLKEHAAGMPRTMLRYAIEKFPEKKRKRYMRM